MKKTFSLYGLNKNILALQGLNNVLFNPWSAEIVYINQEIFFQFEFHYKYFTFSVRESNLDVRIWRLWTSDV